MNSPDCLDTAVIYVAQNPAPVIMFDTCSLLDVIRFPKIGCHNHGNVVVAHKLAKNDNSNAHLLVTRTVMDEWEKNIDRTQDETKSMLSNIDKQHKALFNAIKSLPNLMMGSYPFPRAALLDALNIAPKLRGLMQELIQNAICLPNEDEPLKKASHRVLLNKAPAKKGGGGADCAIIETYLAFVNKLRDKKITERAYFLTSNKEDFCCGQKRIHPDLAEDFERLNIDFIPDLSRLPLD